MQVRAPEGTVCETQDMSMWTTGEQGWVRGNQLWCHDNKVGETVSVDFETTRPWKGELAFGLTKARDYGRISIMLDGKLVVEDFNGYGEGVAPAEVRAGSREPKAGQAHPRGEAARQGRALQRHDLGHGLHARGGPGAPPPKPVVKHKTK